MKNTLFGLFLLTSLAAHAATPLLAAPTASATVATLSCNPFYLPARSIWKRVVDIEVDANGVREIRIDGVAVYSFVIDGSAILTAVDGERIQIDTALLTWSSDLRDIVSSQGRCER